MSKDKRKQEPRDSELLKRLAKWHVEYGRMISGKVPRGYLRLMDLGLVKIVRRKNSPFRPTRYTFVVLTETGKKCADILNAPPTYVPSPHKREPRVEKKVPARDRRKLQAER